MGLELSAKIFNLGGDYFGRLCCSSYNNDESCSRVTRVFIAVIKGIIDFVLFLPVCAIGFAVLPLIACVKYCSGNAGNYMIAWGFCVAGLLTAITYVSASAFAGIDLNASIGLGLGGVTMSILVHVIQNLRNYERKGLSLNHY